MLSKEGAQKLLKLLPVRGPVDLWLNHQFQKLNAFSSTSSLIEQRRDYNSSNFYSVLPILSKVGVLADEGPAKFERGRLRGPVFGIGPENSGFTSLAMSLSMLGYRCCSDVEGLPCIEEASLDAGRWDKVFDAYVNVGSVSRRCLELAMLYPESRIIIRCKGHRIAAAGEDWLKVEGVTRPQEGWAMDAQAGGVVYGTASKGIATALGEVSLHCRLTNEIVGRTCVSSWNVSLRWALFL